MNGDYLEKHEMEHAGVMAARIINSANQFAQSLLTPLDSNFTVTVSERRVRDFIEDIESTLAIIKRDCTREKK